MQEQQGTIPPEGTAEAAADWLIRLRAAPDDAALAERFEAWLAAAPDHQRAFDAQCAVWNLLGDVQRQTARQAPAASHHLTALPRHARPRHAARPHRRMAAAAALAALAASIALLLLPGLLLRLDADFVTGTAETRTVRLADGSSVMLGGKSALAVDMTEGRRSVRLLAGEAFFEVTPDPRRPFVVDAGAAEVRVLGTAFDVRTGDGFSDVALARGAVEATFRDGAGTRQSRMVPGERLHYDTADGALTRDRVPPDEIGAWRDGRLVVTDASVGEVVARIRRYHGAWIALPDPGLAAARVTGVYDLRHPDEALAALVEPFGGRVHALSPYLRILARL